MFFKLRSDKICGKARTGFKTKDLVKELKSGEIAIIDHKNLDEVAAKSLVNAGVKAVINLNNSMTGEFPNRGPGLLLSKKVPLLDKLENKNFLDTVNEGDMIIVSNDLVLNSNGKILTRGRKFNQDIYDSLINKATENMQKNLDNFINNTLEYAINEKEYFAEELDLSEVKTDLKGKKCLIISRGSNHEKDLAVIKDYITNVNPVLIGVDGGADTLLKHKLRPDIVLGDMDSVGERALFSAGEILLHAYLEGHAPGHDRLLKLGLDYSVVSAPGTSEDLAYLVAYQLQAQIIISLGAHTNLVDFYEKGRNGMASTLLTRMKTGDRLIDAKGINELFCQEVKAGSLLLALAASVLPFLTLVFSLQKLQAVVQLLNLKLIHGY